MRSNFFACCAVVLVTAACGADSPETTSTAPATTVGGGVGGEGAGAEGGGAEGGGGEGASGGGGAGSVGGMGGATTWMAPPRAELVSGSNVVSGNTYTLTVQIGHGISQVPVAGSDHLLEADTAIKP